MTARTYNADLQGPTPYILNQGRITAIAFLVRLNMSRQLVRTVHWQRPHAPYTLNRAKGGGNLNVDSVSDCATTWPLASRRLFGSLIRK